MPEATMEEALAFENEAESDDGDDPIEEDG